MSRRGVAFSLRFALRTGLHLPSPPLRVKRRRLSDHDTEASNATAGVGPDVLENAKVGSTP